MSREASIFEYREIIIPLHEEEVQRDLLRSLKYPKASIERKALILSAQLKELHIQFIKFHILELQGLSDKVRSKIKTNKQLEEEVRHKLDNLSVDVRSL